jgi:transposase
MSLKARTKIVRRGRRLVRRISRHLDSRLQSLREKFATMLPLLNEKQRRIAAAVEAQQYGRGGVTAVSRASGMSRQTIYRGLEDLQTGVQTERVRAVGGGRKRLAEHQPKLKEQLESLVQPTVRGDPQSALRWTTRSTRKLQAALEEAGYSASHRSIASLLHEMDYTLQGNRKSIESKVTHVDRDAQFQYINDQATSALSARQPVISVDTKRKELVGNYKNAGQEWRPKGKPLDVSAYDFRDPDVPKAVPYGVYDRGLNTGWVNVGMSGDTAQFAVESIRQWWRHMGKPRYRRARRLLICADSGGSNGYRLQLWKRELQLFANETRLAITVCHFPPGTSKWNAIEHKLFSFITMNWRSWPLTDFRTIIKLISATTTKAGLVVKARLDRRKYERGIKVSRQEMKNLNLTRHEFHGEWNYTISPQRKKA